MHYCGSVFRPPSEAHSLIIQVTYGCSHNRCAFCSMYRDKPFSLRPIDEVLQDLHMARECFPQVFRIFLADGDALIRRASELEGILQYIKKRFPECERVSCYASPASVESKTDMELRTLRALGLKMVYMGLESGCDRILRKMNKGATSVQLSEAGKRVRAAGIILSVTAISGLGGAELWQEHAADTAEVLSEMNPEYIGMLTLMVEPGTPLNEWVQEGSFSVPNAKEILRETQLLLSKLDSPGSVFRMNHASNYLSLRGTLNKDRDAMLAGIRDALSGGKLRPEEYRSL